MNTGYWLFLGFVMCCLFVFLIIYDKKHQDKQ